MGNSKFNVSEAVHCFFPTFSGLKTWFEVFEDKIIWKWSEGKQKLLRVSGSFELSRVRVSEGKITVNVWRKSRRNRFWFELARGSSQRGFELSRVNCTHPPSVHHLFSPVGNVRAEKRHCRVLKGFLIKQTCLTWFTLIPSKVYPQKLDLTVHILLHCGNESMGNAWEIYFASSIQADSLL